MSERYYDALIFVNKNKENVVVRGSVNDPESTLTLRGDIFPVSRKDILRLFKYSVKDIIVTGDQSLTDVLSCCYKDKNIWYQITPWKLPLASGIASQMPNKYLKNYATSCGSLKTLKFEGDYKDFVRDNDFRVKGREKMDSIVALARAMKSSSEVRLIGELILTSRKKETLLHKLQTEFEV